MSTISDIFASYEAALTGSRDAFTDLYTNRAENGRQFYSDFFHKLIVPFRPMFTDRLRRAYLLRLIERSFGSSQLNFVAIDGTCQKDSFTDFAVFFGGAYGAKGRLSLEGDPPKVKYEKWDMNRDVSMVAWIPIPFAQFSDVAGEDVEETFMVSDAESVNTSSLDTNLMQLAEVYLAYNVASSSTIDTPNLILLDQSLSGIMAATSHGANTALVGYPYDRRQLDANDVTIAFAHPFNPDLGVPSAKRFRQYTALIAEFHRRGTRQLSLTDLETNLHLTREQLRAPYLYLNKQGLCSFDQSTETISITVDCRDSWAFTLSLFQNICSRLFLAKDQSALTYQTADPDDPTRLRQRWMSPDDVQFLIAVGLRALIEVCWQKRILLVGIVKDSASRYLSRNYLGAMKHLALYPELAALKVGLLPWTDRVYLETIPTVCDQELEAPWSTVEFDSTFMTLHLGTDQRGNVAVVGTRSQAGEIVAPEGLFVKSLAQFYLSRGKSTPLMGHVVFVDRLAFPFWDKDALDQVSIQTEQLGLIRPIVYRDRGVPNVGQAITMYLLATLTRNHFPEVIGYPDPLHKADWGAKSVGRRVKGMIASSEIPFRSKPIAKTLRSIREDFRR